MRRDGDKDEIDFIGDIADTWISFHSVHHRGAGIDRIDLSLIAPVFQPFDDFVSDLGGVAAGADHGDAPWIQGIRKPFYHIITYMFDFHLISPPWKSSISHRCCECGLAGSRQ